MPNSSTLPATLPASASPDHGRGEQRKVLNNLKRENLTLVSVAEDARQRAAATLTEKPPPPQPRLAGLLRKACSA